MKLGRLPYKHDPRTLQFATYAAGLPTPPAQWNWWRPAWPNPVYANDRFGTCTVAAAGHVLEVWTGSTTGKPRIVTYTDILTMYGRVCPGFNPATGANDNGAVVLDVMKDWAHTGLAGYKIGAYAAVPPTSTLHQKMAINLLGACYIGVNLPQSAMMQFVKRQPWVVVPGSPIIGRHAVPVVAYNDTWVWLLTWARLQAASWQWVLTYCEEAWAMFSQDFINPRGKSPNGFGKQALLADLAAL